MRPEKTFTRVNVMYYVYLNVIIRNARLLINILQKQEVEGKRLTGLARKTTPNRSISYLQK